MHDPSKKIDKSTIGSGITVKSKNDTKVGSVRNVSPKMTTLEKWMDRIKR